jgi:hypothetical protein
MHPYIGGKEMNRKEVTFLLACLTCVLVAIQTSLDLGGTVAFLLAGATCFYSYRRTAESVRQLIPIVCIRACSDQSRRGRRISF